MKNFVFNFQNSLAVQNYFIEISKKKNYEQSKISTVHQYLKKPQNLSNRLYHV